MAKFFISPLRNAKNLFWFPIFLIIYNFTGNLSNDIYIPSMPALAKFFNTSASYIQLTLTLWFMGTAIPQLLLGPLADRYGRRPLLLIGGLVFLLSTLLCILSTHIIVFLIARFFQGVGVCSLTIVSFLVIKELFQDQECIRWLSLLNISNSSAPLIGPVIGGYIFAWSSWHTNFYLVFILGFIGLIGLWYFMPESKSVLNKFALAPKFLINHYLTLLKKPTFVKPLLSFGILFGGMIAYLTAAPFIIINHLKILPQHFGYTQVVIFSAFILGNYLTGLLNRFFISKKIIFIGKCWSLLGGISLILAGKFFPLNLYTFIGSIMLYSFGFGLASSHLAKETLSVNEDVGGFAAALLGFSMTGIGFLGSLTISLLPKGNILSLGWIICLMGGIVILLEFFRSE